MTVFSKLGNVGLVETKQTYLRESHILMSLTFTIRRIPLAVRKNTPSKRWHSGMGAFLIMLLCYNE